MNTSPTNASRLTSVRVSSDQRNLRGRSRGGRACWSRRDHRAEAIAPRRMKTRIIRRASTVCDSSFDKCVESEQFYSARIRDERRSLSVVALRFPAAACNANGARDERAGLRDGVVDGDARSDGSAGDADAIEAHRRARRRGARPGPEKSEGRRDRAPPAKATGGRPRRPRVRRGKRPQGGRRRRRRLPARRVRGRVQRRPHQAPPDQDPRRAVHVLPQVRRRDATVSVAPGRSPPPPPRRFVRR